MFAIMGAEQQLAHLASGVALGQQIAQGEEIPSVLLIFLPSPAGAPHGASI